MWALTPDVRAGVAGDGPRTRPGWTPGLRRSRAGRCGGPRQREEHAPVDEEQPAPHLLPTNPIPPGKSDIRVRGASPLEALKAAAQGPNLRSCATAFTSGDGGN